MARRRVHSDDVILDAARDLLVQGGPESTTTAAISARSGAPTGSLYHRYGSRTRLFAELWVRTVTRFQTGLLAAAATGAGVERVLAAADWIVEFAARHPADARLLLQTSRGQLLANAELPAETTRTLVDLNKPVADLLHELAVDLFGTATPHHVERLTIAMVDVPYAIVRRHLQHGTSAAPYRHLVADTVRALLEPTPQ
jgi:AcrR family transcriptional regulator